ncbi:MAG: hypothetical protein IKK75_02530 [Clostridia bacterium]|nr:hypothetical protein [Clostridia bacterium]
MHKRWFLCALVLVLAFFAQAGAEEITISEVLTESGSNSVRYPQLAGMQDEAVQQKINDDIVLSSGVTNHMISLLTLVGQQTLNVDYDAYLDEEIFSVIISAKGKLPQKRDGHAYTALTYDLATGERLTLDALFADVDAAVAAMEEKVVDTLSEELNGYLEYSEITPLPVDSFTLDEHGITFWYPAEQFSLLSGYSGACQFWYSELEGLWLNDPTTELTADEQKAAIEQSVSSGVIPHVPVSIGGSVREAADAYRLLRTPDEFPGGRYFVMEHPAFRSIMVISDAMQAEYDASVVEGIQLRRGDLHGLLIGQTAQTEWLELLGEPDETLIMTENMAYDYALSEGLCDMYLFGENELRLYADTDGILYAIQICK